MTAGSASVLTNSAQPFAWFDESVIENEHDVLVSKNKELKEHLQVFHHCFDLLNVILRNHPYEGNAEALATLRLVARVFNTSGACLKLGRAGYFQPAFSMVRDILEVEFLADMFVRDPKYLKRWIAADPKTRRKEFSQVKIREFLDQLDGFKKGNRAKAYPLIEPCVSCKSQRLPRYLACRHDANRTVCFKRKTFGTVSRTSQTPPDGLCSPHTNS